MAQIHASNSFFSDRSKPHPSNISYIPDLNKDQVISSVHESYRQNKGADVTAKALFDLIQIIAKESSNMELLGAIESSLKKPNQNEEFCRIMNNLNQADHPCNMRKESKGLLAFHNKGTLFQVMVDSEIMTLILSDASKNFSQCINPAMGPNQTGSRDAAQFRHNHDFGGLSPILPPRTNDQMFSFDSVSDVTRSEAFSLYLDEVKNQTIDVKKVNGTQSFSDGTFSDFDSSRLDKGSYSQTTPYHVRMVRRKSMPMRSNKSNHPLSSMSRPRRYSMIQISGKKTKTPDEYVSSRQTEVNEALAKASALLSARRGSFIPDAGQEDERDRKIELAFNQKKTRIENNLSLITNEIKNTKTRLSDLSAKRRLYIDIRNNIKECMQNDKLRKYVERKSYLKNIEYTNPVLHKLKLFLKVTDQKSTDRLYLGLSYIKKLYSYDETLKVLNDQLRTLENSSESLDLNKQVKLISLRNCKEETTGFIQYFSLSMYGLRPTAVKDTELYNYLELVGKKRKLKLKKENLTSTYTDLIAKGPVNNSLDESGLTCPWGSQDSRELSLELKNLE